MSAGTITITNGSAIVGGVDTTFSTELAPGDFIVTTVGGVPYTLPIMTIDSDTQLTLVSNFTGPTQAGAAWSAIPRVALNMVTAALVAQSAEALRGLNYDKQNWQQVFSAAGNITVKLPDGTTFTGPSWKYVISQTSTLNGKTGGTVSGSVIATSGNQVGIASGSGGNKSISLSNVSSDGPTENYVNWIAGNYYAGIWRMGAIRGAGTDLNRVQMNIFDGISTNSDYRWYSDGRFRSKSVQAPGVGGGGGYMDIGNADNTNISFSRPNLTQNNDSGYVPALRWHSGASGGYHAATAIGSVANGASAWPSIVMMTLGDGGNAGTRAWQFNLVSGDIYVSGTGGFAGDYVFNKSATSDANLKKDITYTDGKASVENIKAMKPTTFIYKNDEKERVRRGVIAQDIMLIDPDYVKEVPGGIEIEEDGTETQKPSTLALDNNVLLVDAVLALNYVIKQLEATQKELADLRNNFAGS
ncbi:tail fiber domain-containing protein [Enterobacter sp. 22325]|uniref:tail fiber domain-containing protein n=1 Tax=Enterobacter sp. 22325 TaxID=3453911 RepID=UPI003F83CD30